MFVHILMLQDFYSELGTDEMTASQADIVSAVMAFTLVEEKLSE